MLAENDPIETRKYIVGKALGDALQVDSITPARLSELQWEHDIPGRSFALHTEDRLNVARAILFKVPCLHSEKPSGDLKSRIVTFHPAGDFLKSQEELYPELLKCLVNTRSRVNQR